MGLSNLTNSRCVFGLVILFFSVLCSATTVRLITVGPGDAFWSVYGHTALAIDDDVYGFGYFDFDGGHLISAFIANDMRYEMGVSDFDDELYYAKRSHRRFSVQTLNLPTLAVNELQQSLARHYRPENRHYHYDYLTNNCATKIRDLLNIATNNKLYERAQNTSGQGYADLTIPAYHQSAMSLGLSLGYGYKAYRPLSDWQTMAFPLALESFMAQHMADFIVAEQTVYSPPQETWLAFKNHLVLVLLLVLLMAAIIPMMRFYIINGWYWILSMLGFVILALWFFSAHPIAIGNFNLLLANPLLFLASFKNTARWVFITLLVGQLLWIVASIIFSVGYLLPLAVVNLVFLWVSMCRNRAEIN